MAFPLIFDSTFTYLYILTLFHAYLLTSHEVFYLITRRPATGFGKIGLYFPKTELIIDYRLHPGCSVQWFLCCFKSYMVTNWEKVRAYLLRSSNPEIVAVVGHDNLGHYLVNVLSGLQKHIDALGVNLSKIDKFLVHGTEYFGSTNDIFPEIPVEKIERIDLTELPQKILDRNYFVLRLGNNLVVENLVNRINFASINQCSLSFLTQVEEAKKCFPLVSISFRCHKRSWVSQIEGIANIIRKIFADFPNLGVVFDGFSLASSSIDNGGKYSSYVKTQIENDNAVVNQILDLLANNNIKIYNTVGCRMHESIIWAYAVDFYIANMGSNLTKNCTLANKPGIGHTNTYYIELSKKWFTNTRENSCIPTIIPAHYIIDIEPTKGVNSNYDLDWKIIYDEAMKLIPQLSRTP